MNHANAVGVSWLSPSECFPPHRITHPEKASQLCQEFLTTGWDMKCGPLTGYPFGDGIQLLNGSHRWAAAMGAGIKVPVKVVPYDLVEWSWGNLERWAVLVAAGGQDGQGIAEA